LAITKSGYFEKITKSGYCGVGILWPTLLQLKDKILMIDSKIMTEIK
jgi:hypothetical protein